MVAQSQGFEPELRGGAPAGQTGVSGGCSYSGTRVLVTRTQLARFPARRGQRGGAIPCSDLSRARVVGINPAIIAMAQGIGFAIPSNTARWVISQLLTHGRVRRAYLGLAARQRPLGRRQVRFHGLSNQSAVEVVSVDPEGPAGKAGVQPGDLIVAMNGRPVESVDALHSLLSDWPPGRAVTLTIVRWMEKIDLEAVPSEVEPSSRAAARSRGGPPPCREGARAGAAAPVARRIAIRG